MKRGRSDLRRILRPLLLRLGVQTQGEACLLPSFDNKANGSVSSTSLMSPYLTLTVPYAVTAAVIRILKMERG